MAEEISRAGKVLFVDDDETIRDLMSQVAEVAGIKDYEILEDAEQAVTRIAELDEAAAAIFSDGLNGGWRDVIDAAKAARIPAFVTSSDTYIQPEVEEAGITFIPKNKLAPKLLRAVLADLHDAD